MLGDFEALLTHEFAMQQRTIARTVLFLEYTKAKLVKHMDLCLGCPSQAQKLPHCLPWIPEDPAAMAQ